MCARLQGVVVEEAVGDVQQRGVRAVVAHQHACTAHNARVFTPLDAAGRHAAAAWLVHTWMGQTHVRVQRCQQPGHAGHQPEPVMRCVMRTQPYEGIYAAPVAGEMPTLRQRCTSAWCASMHASSSDTASPACPGEAPPPRAAAGERTTGPSCLRTRQRDLLLKPAGHRGMRGCHAWSGVLVAHWQACEVAVSKCEGYVAPCSGTHCSSRCQHRAAAQA